MKIWYLATVSTTAFLLFGGSSHLAFGSEESNLPACALHSGGHEVTLSKKCCHESHNIQSWFAQLNEETKANATVGGMHCSDDFEWNMTDFLLEHSEDSCIVSKDGHHECTVDYSSGDQTCVQQYMDHCGGFGGALVEVEANETFECQNTTANDAPDFILTVRKQMVCIGTSCGQNDRQKYDSFYRHHIFSRKYSKVGCTHINGLPNGAKTNPHDSIGLSTTTAVCLALLALVLFLVRFLGRRPAHTHYARLGFRPSSASTDSARHIV